MVSEAPTAASGRVDHIVLDANTRAKPALAEAIHGKPLLAPLEAE
jgi:hypothetical protein